MSATDAEGPKGFAQSSAPFDASSTREPHNARRGDEARRDVQAKGERATDAEGPKGFAQSSAVSTQHHTRAAEHISRGVEARCASGSRGRVQTEATSIERRAWSASAVE
jgi:hypothetical protein